jgi:hypothetical protein
VGAAGAAGGGLDRGPVLRGALPPVVLRAVAVVRAMSEKRERELERETREKTASEPIKNTRCQRGGVT